MAKLRSSLTRMEMGKVVVEIARREAHMVLLDEIDLQRLPSLLSRPEDVELQWVICPAIIPVGENTGCGDCPV